MNLILNLIVALQILTALVMIGLVLIQHGKGADMGASFGSGSSGSLFGATGSANFMSRSTAVCAAVFFGCTLALAYFSNDRARPSTGSVLDRPVISAPAASIPATGAAQVPSASGVPATPPAPMSGAKPASGLIGSTPSAAASVPPVPAPTPARSASGAGAIPTP